MIESERSLTAFERTSSTVLIKKVVFVITYLCNMRCTYCYYGNENLNILSNKAILGKTVMSCEVVEKSLHLFENMGLLARDVLYFHIFGGEPSMFPEIIYCIHKKVNQLTKSRKIALSISTNGYYFSKKFLEVLGKIENVEVTVSIDGPQVVHDNQRKDILGNPTFDRIVSNVKKLVKMRVNNKIRRIVAEVTVTKHTLESGLLRTVEFLRNLGFDDVVLHVVEGVNELKPDVSMYFRNKIELLKVELERLLSSEPPLYSGTVSLIRAVLNPSIRQCDAGRSLVAVTPEGDIYPCQGFVGLEEFRIGNLEDLNSREEFLRNVQRVLRRMGNKLMDPRCAGCAFVRECPKICLASNVLDGRDPYQFSDEYCDVIRKEVEIIHGFLKRLSNNVGERRKVVEGMRRWASGGGSSL